MVISGLVDTIVSIKRISSFLDSDEIQADARDVLLKGDNQDGDEVLSITNGEFSWSKNEKEPILQDIDLTVKKGELVAVLGQAGAGKASIQPAFLWISGIIYHRIQLSRVVFYLLLSGR